MDGHQLRVERWQGKSVKERCSLRDAQICSELGPDGTRYSGESSPADAEDLLDVLSDLRIGRAGDVVERHDVVPVLPPQTDGTGEEHEPAAGIWFRQGLPERGTGVRLIQDVLTQGPEDRSLRSATHS